MHQTPRFGVLAGESTASVAPARSARGLLPIETPSQPGNLPLQMISAGPVSRIAASLAGHTVRCGSTFCMRRKFAIKLRNAIAAADEAHVPVPEEVVGPHPRSKIRKAISDSEITCTNSTFVP